MTRGDGGNGLPPPPLKPPMNEKIGTSNINVLNMVDKYIVFIRFLNIMGKASAVDIVNM